MVATRTNCGDKPADEVSSAEGFVAASRRHGQHEREPFPAYIIFLAEGDLAQAGEKAPLQ